MICPLKVKKPIEKIEKIELREVKCRKCSKCPTGSDENQLEVPELWEIFKIDKVLLWNREIEEYRQYSELETKKDKVKYSLYDKDYMI